MIRTRLLMHLIHAAVVATGICLLLTPPARAQEGGPAPGRPLPGQAGDFTLKLEPGVAIPLTKPQSERFNVGGGQTVKALWLLTEQLDIGPSVTFMSLPSEAADSESGTAWTFGASLRFKRSHSVPGEGFEAVSPWGDVDLLYVRTGKLNRPGFALAAGLAVPVGEARVFWIGPFVRYLHILQGDPAGFDNHDAKILSLGLSLEVGPGVRRERQDAPVAAAPVAPVEPRVVEKEVFVCEDRDKDDIPDKVDHCPDVAGPMEGFGCPQYKKVVVKKDKLELKEKLFFAWNQATLKEVSFPVLDEVAQALKDNKGFKVQVEGHSSSEGGEERNQTLSEQRAQTVVDYLVAHGVERERLVSKGRGASVPIDTNATPAGREANRRVQFVVNFSILNDGSK
jgi:outer membrane protein OmpA-like peptidoglycan-associated protein